MNRRYHRPPTWPPAPEGWTPPKGWIPDPGWPRAPRGWVFWTDEPEVEVPNTIEGFFLIPTQRRAVEEWAWQDVRSRV
ncbi:hypothetical protein ACWFNE_13280 [Cellulomonas sp. NPDC055163]